MKRELTCVECPMGCAITVEMDGDRILSVTGNTCKRGEMYARNEVVCPMRVVTSTVRGENGKMVPVKTNQPVKKSEIFRVMEIISRQTAHIPARVGDIVLPAICDGADLVVAGDVDE